MSYFFFIFIYQVIVLTTEQYTDSIDPFDQAGFPNCKIV